MITNECINCNRTLRGAKEIDLCGYCNYMLNQGKLQAQKDVLEIIENLNPSNFRIQGAKAYQIELKQKIQAPNQSQQHLRTSCNNARVKSNDGTDALKRSAITNGEMESSPALIKGLSADNIQNKQEETK